jgi:hypothetical protein
MTLEDMQFRGQEQLDSWIHEIVKFGDEPLHNSKRSVECKYRDSYGHL